MSLKDLSMPSNSAENQETDSARCSQPTPSICSFSPSICSLLRPFVVFVPSQRAIVRILQSVRGGLERRRVGEEEGWRGGGLERIKGSWLQRLVTSMSRWDSMVRECSRVRR